MVPDISSDRSPAKGFLNSSNGPSAPRAVVFDLDGTLIDSMPFVLRAFAHALAPFRPDLNANDIFLRLGGPPERTLLELTGDAAKANEALRRLDAFGFTDVSLVPPFAGVHAFLTTLVERGLRLAVWTGRDRMTTEMILRGHGLAEFFRDMVCGDDLSSHKPHPEGLVALMQRLRVSPVETVFVGDSDVDVIGGAEAGVRTVLIDHGRVIPNGVKERVWRQLGRPDEAYRFVGDACGVGKYLSD